MTAVQPALVWGPLVNTVDVVAFIALTGMTWYNAIELLWTILVSFRRWTGRYFWCLMVATCGVMCYQLNVFFMIFGTPKLNVYAVILGIDIGWTCMVTGQSLVLWSRLHLVCRSQWKLQAILYMIIFNAVTLHIPQMVFSLLGIKNGAEDPTYKPFEILEKIAISIFTVQELIISSVYLYETVRILRVGEMVHKKDNKRRVQLLFLANVAIIAIDVTTVTLEFLALWGVWCSFKGFGYSVKLKIEFAILNQLRDSVSNNSGGISDYESSRGISLSSRPRKSMKPGKHQFSQLEDGEQITKTTEVSISVQPHDNTRSNGHIIVKSPASETSSEIEFASKGGV